METNTTSLFFPPTKRSFVVLDTETTGLNEYQDELLEIAIVDPQGTTLFHSYLTPVRNTTWEDAEAIHGISPAFIFGGQFPTLVELTPQLIAILTNQDVVMYNAGFDAGFIPDILKQAGAEVYDVMVPFADFYGDWSEYWGNNQWQRLTTAARYVLFDWVKNPHSALGDALATLAVWMYLTEPAERNRVETKRKLLLDEKLINQAIDDLLWIDERLQQSIDEAAYRVSNRNLMRFLGINRWLDCVGYLGDAERSADVFCQQLTGYSVYDWLAYGEAILRLPRYTKADKPDHYVTDKEVYFLKGVSQRPKPVAMLNRKKKSLDLVELVDLSKLVEGVDYVFYSVGDWPENCYSKSTLQRQFKLKSEQIEGLTPTWMRIGYKFNYLLYSFTLHPVDN